MSRHKVLVIGAGLFGADVAILLAQNGFDVTVVEKKVKILDGTTGSSLLRVHSGLHYPRHFDTAQQSMLGFNLFKDKYKEFIYDSFPNFYAIANLNSKTSVEQFEHFANKLGFPYEKCEDDIDPNLRLNKKKISSIYKVNEGVVNIPKLRTYFMETFKLLTVNLLTDSEVVNIEKSKFGSNWLITVKSLIKGKNNSNYYEIFKEEYDYVIDATHSINNYLNSIKKQLDNEFQITHMLNIDFNSSPFGLTILDGNFLSILPLVDDGKILATLYAPLPSVRSRHVGNGAPLEWLNTPNLQNLFSLGEAELQILNAADEWLPGLSSSKVVSAKTGIRVIESNVTDTDKRQSSVKIIALGLYSIGSTKLDHCIEISEQLLKLIKSL
jgi:hypothetical protein